MFGEARPILTSVRISVAKPDLDCPACARCKKHLFNDQVAAYTRTAPGEPFDPWCPKCFRQLVVWAGMGAVSYMEESDIAEFLEVRPEDIDGNL